MIILGLGSNMGDRLAHLREALAALKKIPGVEVQQISPVYLSDAMLPENAPEDWDQPYFNAALRCETTLKPEELLATLKQIEMTLGNKPVKRHWGPRIIDIDILAWDNLIFTTDALTIPHTNFHLRPFALWPFADVAPFWQFPNGLYQGKTAAEATLLWGSRFSGEAPFHTKQIQQRIDTPRLVGILNITPNSFSDGGRFTDAQAALNQAQHLIASGAEIIDIGAQSTTYHADVIGPEREWQKLEPVLLSLKAASREFLLPPKISIDTFHADVAARALDLGVDWINDVSGLTQPAMIELIAQTKTDCVMMHHLTVPASREHVVPYHEDILNLVYQWGEKRILELERAGINKEKIIFDPGIAFGKLAEHSLELIKHIHIFKNLGVRILVGHSRKSFLSLFTAHPAAERDIETMVTALYLANQAVDYLRVHHVEICARGLKMAAAF